MTDESLPSLPSSLWRRAVESDQNAWENIIRVFGPLVEQWLVRLRVPSADLEDLQQETFRAMFRSLGQFDRSRSGATFRGWLWTITKNQSLDFHRRRAREIAATGGSTANQMLAEHAEEFSDSATHPPESEPDGVLKRGLELIRAEFNEKTWRAFYLTAVEEKSAAEAAAELDMSPGHVYVAKSRVLKRSREELGEFLD